jgi:hypothetical protein
MAVLPVVAFRSISVKIVPFLLAGGLLATAALAPMAGRKDQGLDYADMFVQCSDRLGPASCSGFLDRWEEDRPAARAEIMKRFAHDQAFAMHLIALTDAQILTGAISRDGTDARRSARNIEQPFPGE